MNRIKEIEMEQAKRKITPKVLVLRYDGEKYSSCQGVSEGRGGCLRRMVIANRIKEIENKENIE